MMQNPDKHPDCPHCDAPGASKTFDNQVCMPVNGRVQCIDRCIHQIVAALNAGGLTTIASCCGHGQMPGRIDLQDGRMLVITRDPDQLVWQDLEQ